MRDYTDWSEEEIQKRARGLKALRSALRLRILAALAEAESNVRDLESHIPVSQPLISWHLNQLRQAGFVKARRAGREVWYQICPEAFRDLARDLELLLGFPLAAHDGMGNLYTDEEEGR